MFKDFFRILSALVFFCAPVLAQSSSTGDLRAQIEQISRDANGRVGVALTLLESGESVALLGDQRFPMQSVYKLPIGMAVLNQIDQGRLSLEQKVRVTRKDFVRAGQHSPVRDKNPRGVELSVKELLRFMVSESDGTACDVLLRLVGGPQVVTSYLRGLGIHDIRVADMEKEIGRNISVQYRNWASPIAMVELLHAIHKGRGLSSASRALLLQMMIETSTGPRRIKGLLPAGTVVAHRTGSSGEVNGLAPATNDVGLITLPNEKRIAVAVFVSDSRVDTAMREAVIARIAKAAWDFWGN
ncbi:MAG: class A beta-lactamase [Blastocatellia bacterium]